VGDALFVGHLSWIAEIKYLSMKKIVNLKRCFLLLLIPLVIAGCGGNDSENNEADNKESQVEVVPEIVVDYNVKDILSNYSVRPKQEEAVLKIMDNVDYYLQVNIDEVLKKSLKKKKRAKKLNEVFLHGKISAKSLEFFINDKIEEYNDDQIIADRLNNVTLEIVMDTMTVSTLYNKLLTIEWMKSHVYDFSYDRWIDNGESKSEKREIVGEEMMNAYHSLFKAENLIEQMIGVENNK